MSFDLINCFNKEETITIDFKTINLPSFLYNLEKLRAKLLPYMDRQIYLCLSSADTLSSITKIFTETGVKFSLNPNDKGLILTQLAIPYNICLEDEDKLYIGSKNFAHKKEIK